MPALRLQIPQVPGCLGNPLVNAAPLHFTAGDAASAAQRWGPVPANTAWAEWGGLEGSLPRDFAARALDRRLPDVPPR